MDEESLEVADAADVNGEFVRYRLSDSSHLIGKTHKNIPTNLVYTRHIESLALSSQEQTKREAGLVKVCVRLFRRATNLIDDLKTF